MKPRMLIVVSAIALAVFSGMGALAYFAGIDGVYGWEAAWISIGIGAATIGSIGLLGFLLVRSLLWAGGDDPFIPESWTRWFKKTFKGAGEPSGNTITFDPKSVSPIGNGGAVALLKPGESVISASDVRKLSATLSANVTAYTSAMTTAASLTATVRPPVSEEFGGRGFAAGSVKGARSWNIDKLGRLIGVTYPQVWVPGENHAACRKTDPFSIRYTVNPSTMKIERDSSEDRPAPDHGMDTCGHGFYGYYEGSNDYGSEARVSGVVEAYGETVIGTRGFRAMKARILALTFGDDVTEAQRKLVTRNYPDAVIYETFAEMVAAVPPDAGGQEYGPDVDPEFWVREA